MFDAFPLVYRENLFERYNEWLWVYQQIAAKKQHKRMAFPLSFLFFLLLLPHADLTSGKQIMNDRACVDCN